MQINDKKRLVKKIIFSDTNAKITFRAHKMQKLQFLQKLNDISYFFPFNIKRIIPHTF